MTKTVNDIKSALVKRASRVGNTELFFIINSLVANDIKDDLFTTYSEDFKAKQSYTLVASDYDYALPSDYEDVFAVTDKNGGKLIRKWSNASVEPPSRFTNAFWISGGNINFNQNISLSVGDSFYLEYYKKLDEVDDVTDDLPVPIELHDILYPVYVSGVEYFFFDRNRKITDRQLALGRYQSAKQNAFHLASI